MAWGVPSASCPLQGDGSGSDEPGDAAGWLVDWCGSYARGPAVACPAQLCHKSFGNCFFHFVLFKCNLKAGLVMTQTQTVALHYLLVWCRNVIGNRDAINQTDWLCVLLNSWRFEDVLVLFGELIIVTWVREVTGIASLGSFFSCGMWLAVVFQLCYFYNIPLYERYDRNRFNIYILQCDVAEHNQSKSTVNQNCVRYCSRPKLWDMDLKW